MPRPPVDSSNRLAVWRAVFTGGLGLATSTAAIALLLLPAPPNSNRGLTLPDSMIEMTSAAHDLVSRPDSTIIPQQTMQAGTPQLLPVQGWFSDGFRWRQDPLTGHRRFHRGLDIVAPDGAIVRAPADGVVTHASEAGGYGNMIEIRHGEQYSTRFAHLETFLTDAGRIVRLGQPIGLVGSSGRTKGAHLHYEVIRDGRRVNPWMYLGDQKRTPGQPTFSMTRATVRASG